MGRCHGMNQDTDESETELVRDKYTPDQDRSLSGAILEAIEEFRDEDMAQSDFLLYEDIDPDALDSLFRHDAQPRTTVEFDTDDVRVELYGDDGVVITVRERPTG